MQQASSFHQCRQRAGVPPSLAGIKGKFNIKEKCKWKIKGKSKVKVKINEWTRQILQCKSIIINPRACAKHKQPMMMVC